MPGLRMLTGAVVSVMLLAGGGPVAAQDGDRATVRVSGFAAASVREGVTGLRFAEDVLTYSARLTLPYQSAYQPWVQAGLFTRPELECPPGLTCSTEGVTVLAGVVAPLSRDDTGPGAHPYFLGGVGWAFAEEDRFAYVLGLGGAYAVSGRVAPSVEVRWEDLPGIRNVMMVSLGLRLDLF